MEELIEKIETKAGITSQQAQLALEAVKDFILQKFPMMEGMVEGLLNSNTGQSSDDGLDG